MSTQPNQAPHNVMIQREVCPMKGYRLDYILYNPELSTETGPVHGRNTRAPRLSRVGRHP